LLDFTSRIERLHVCYYCADVKSVLAHFCSDYNRARPPTGRSGQVIDSVCMSQFSVFMTRVADQLFALNCDRNDRAISSMLCTGA